MIDVFSDNVTLPTPEMCEAMFNSGMSEDADSMNAPISCLEACGARLLGKESALFMPTATQCNLVAVLCQAKPGHEVIMGPDSHIYGSEFGGVAAVGGVMVRTWSEVGIPSPKVLREACAPHYRYPGGASSPPALVCLENTHCSSGGTVISPSIMRELRAATEGMVPRYHLDGARIFNAAAALGTSAEALAEEVDTVTVSLDKCLSAPYGALLCGPAVVISEARRWRRMLGGLARKVGPMAAAGLVALQQMVSRVGDDNARAASIASRLAGVEALEIAPYPIPSNLVMLRLGGLRISPAQFAEQLEKNYGVRGHVFGRETVRLAIHRHIGTPEEDAIVDGLTELMSGLRRG